MKTKDIKRYGDRKVKRLPKKVFEKHRPPTSYNNGGITRQNYKGRFLNKGGKTDEELWKARKKIKTPEFITCPKCKKDLPKGKVGQWWYCWMCQIGLCIDCLADDKQCFEIHSTYGHNHGELVKTNTTVCRNCLWRKLKYPSSTKRGTIRDDFVMPKEFKMALRRFPEALPTFKKEENPFYKYFLPSEST